MVFSMVRFATLLACARPAFALVAPVARAPLPTAMSAGQSGGDVPLAATLLAASAAALPELLADNFGRLDEATMTALAAASGDAGTAAASARVAAAINAETGRRVGAARDNLEMVLDGEDLLAMDKRLVQLARRGGVDVPFLLCVSSNAAEAEAGSDRKNVLEHLYTRAQEELEKQADPAAAVLHRLHRQPDAAIRDNIYREFLAPRAELVGPGGADAKRVPLAVPLPPVISHAAFSKAIDDAVAALRTLDADGDLVRENIEQCRAIAIEARAVLVETAPPEDVEAFQDVLAATWPIGTRD